MSASVLLGLSLVDTELAETERSKNEAEVDIWQNEIRDFVF